MPLKGTPHQVTYFAEKNLYPLIVSFPVSLCVLLLLMVMKGAVIHCRANNLWCIQQLME